MSELIFYKTIRIAVSDDVRLTKLETEIIDTRAFQRLRQIKQLGPSAWVYPTALHTRFDHSIGVLSTVDDMVKAINSAKTNVRSTTTPAGYVVTPAQRKLARLYGLLHDITHVPFGHTLEDELKIFDSHDSFQESGTSPPRFEIPLGEHSAIGQLIIEHEGRPFYDRFCNIYLKGKTERLLVHENSL